MLSEDMHFPAKVLGTAAADNPIRKKDIHV
jgi:hypothetical protein